MILKDNPFLRLLLIYTIYNVSLLFFSSLFELYFSTLGLSLPEIILTNLFLFISPLPLIFFLKDFNPKRAIPIGLLSIGLSAAWLLAFHDPTAPYVCRFLLGLSVFFFWLPFNAEYYRCSKNNNAFLGAIYYSVNPVLSLFLPLFSGWFVASLGYPALFSVSIVLFVISALAAYILAEDRNYTFDIRKSMDSISGLKTLIFIEGFSIGTIATMTLSTMLLLYAKNPIGFGGVLSGVTIFSIIASFITAKLSDRYQERRVFLVLSALGLLLSALAFNISQTAFVFFLAFGAVDFFRMILLPLPLALAVDHSRDLAKTMAAREAMLAAGRICAVILGFALTSLIDIRAMLIMQTVAIAIYIPVFELKKKKLAKITRQPSSL